MVSSLPSPSLSLYLLSSCFRRCDPSSRPRLAGGGERDGEREGAESGEGDRESEREKERRSARPRPCSADADVRPRLLSSRDWMERLWVWVRVVWEGHGGGALGVVGWVVGADRAGPRLTERRTTACGVRLELALVLVLVAEARECPESIEPLREGIVLAE